MNRGFLIIFVPAGVVALAYLAVGWGYRVSLKAGLLMLLVTGVALLVYHKRREAGR